MPQPKKPASTRARANRAAGAAKLDLTKKYPVPAMPTGVKWHPQVRLWWKSVWSAPMSNEWHDSDRANVVLAAMLLNDFWTATSATARKESAAEFRQHRAALGLTPYDRRRLEWEFRSPNDPAVEAAAAAAAAAAEAAKQPKQPKRRRKPTGSDPRLELVK